MGGMPGADRNAASKWLAAGIGILFLATVAALGLEILRKSKSSMPKVTIGANDEVYYSRAATQADALALGHALQNTGFFAGRGASVLLSKGGGGTVVSFVLNEGAWNHAEGVAGFEEIGRRIATSIGGFPIRIHLVDSRWNVRKSLAVGKTIIGTRDAIYYLGSASEEDAKALGQALGDAGYLADLGAHVVISKGDGDTIGFVVGEGVWDRPEEVAGFERLARRVAASIGGLPIKLRLLNSQMEVKREVAIQ